MTGSEFSSIFDLKIDKAYSSFLNNTKRDRLFKEALFTSVEKKYRSLDKQKEYDEISSAIKTNVTYSLNNNTIATAPIPIATPSSVSTLVTIITAIEHNLSVGDTVTVAGIAGGVTNMNGTWTVDSINSDFSFSFTSSGAPSGAITLNTGYITYDKMISDYLHLLTVKPTFSKEIDNIEIESISNTSPIKITISGQNNLRSGEKITISGVYGNTNANGTFYIKKINKDTIALYSDAKLKTEVAGNSKFFVGGTLSKVTSKYAVQYISDNKISVFAEPVVTDPQYEIARNKIKFYPLTETCSEIAIDYISNDIQLISAADTAIDLEQYYPSKFLYYVADEAANLFAQSVKDGELFQSSDFELKTNP